MHIILKLCFLILIFGRLATLFELNFKPDTEINMIFLKNFVIIMAASMLRCSNRVLTNFKPRHTQQIRNGYVVLLPEIPTDTPETNPLLRQNVPVPRISDVTADNCVNAIGKTIVDYECGLTRIEEDIQESPKFKKDFDSLIVSIEKLSAPLDYVWSTFKNILAVNYTSEMINIYNNLHSRVSTARFLQFNSRPIYHALSEVSADQSNLSEFQSRAVDKYLLEARLNGVELTGYNASHFQNVVKKISFEKDVFRKKIHEATRRFKHEIHDYAVVREFPPELLRNLALDSTDPTRGPWRVTLQPPVYEEFLKYCSDRDLRWNTWRAYNLRGSAFGDSNLSTSLNMEEIRFQRRDQAKLLGYSSYADLSMETKMAGTVENVQSMIASLKIKSRPALDDALADLQEFAMSRGFEGNLELYDIAYWRRKQCQTVYGLNENELRNYFPFENVLRGLFDLCHFLFGVTFKDCTADAQIWNEHVKFYQVYNESNSNMGSFYVDPYYRSEKISLNMTELGINRCDALGIKPCAFLTFNFQPPLNEVPSLLSVDDVRLLFQKFGNILQHTLTVVPYSEVAGLTNVEWDAVDICAHFMSFWLNDVKTLQTISCHHQNEEKLSEDLCTKIIKARQHLASFDLTRELYLSALDLEIYSSKDYWLDIVKRLWPEYMPFPLDKLNSHPCSFSEIFCDEYAAAYYSSKWSEMIAADIYSAFQEVGMKNEVEIKSTGKRFRESFLSLGGGCHPSEVFRRFRGRDPSLEALLNVNGIDG